MKDPVFLKYFLNILRCSFSFGFIFFNTPDLLCMMFDDDLPGYSSSGPVCVEKALRGPDLEDSVYPESYDDVSAVQFFEHAAEVINFENLLKKVTQELGREYRSFVPIVSDELLENLIKRCIQRYQDQLRFGVGGFVSYIQKQNVSRASDVIITGDLHGSASSVIRILKNASENIAEGAKYVFLGDYVDRGTCGVEVLALLMSLKLEYWDSVFLLRGNHECYALNLAVDVSGVNFQNELMAKYGVMDGIKLHSMFCGLYECLPLALFLGTDVDTWAQFCHAGFSPNFNPQSFLHGENNIQEFNFVESDAWSCCSGFIWGDLFQRGLQIVQDSSARGDSSRLLPSIFNVLSRDASCAVECTCVKALFRGHQHGVCGLSMFPFEVRDEDAEFLASLGFKPRPWYTVADRFLSDSKGYKIEICKYIPIFTILSADAGIGITQEPYYGILHMNGNFDDWSLTPMPLFA